MTALTVSLPTPWLDRMGRFSWLKTVCLALALAPGLWIIVQAVTGDLGPRPVTAAIHQTGDMAIRLLIVTLAITPLRRVAQWPRVLIVRRLLGLASLAYLAVHFSLYVYDQKLDLIRVASEIALRFYLTIGFAALLGMAAMGWTSNDSAIKRMGAEAWGRLHRLIYPVAVLGLLHFALQSKRDVTEAMILGGLFLLLMLARWADGRGKATAAAFAALAIVAALAAAFGEAAWYSFASGVNGWMVLQANWDWDMAPRPSFWVLLGGLALAAFRLARPAPQRGRPA